MASGKNTKCLSAVPYPTKTGLCQSALEDILLSMNCESGESPLVLRDNEENAGLLIPALLSQSPSPECREAVIPFLCLHLFGLCDSSGVSIQPTSGQCRNVRDNLCSAEWQAATTAFDLPDCDSFPEEQASYCGSDKESGSASGELILSEGPLLPHLFSPSCFAYFHNTLLPSWRSAGW